MTEDVTTSIEAIGTALFYKAGRASVNIQRFSERMDNKAAHRLLAPIYNALMKVSSCSFDAVWRSRKRRHKRLMRQLESAA